LHSEVQLLRRLSGLPLCSLTVEEPSQEAGVTLAKHG